MTSPSPRTERRMRLNVSGRALATASVCSHVPPLRMCRLMDEQSSARHDHYSRTGLERTGRAEGEAKKQSGKDCSGSPAQIGASVIQELRSASIGFTSAARRAG